LFIYVEGETIKNVNNRGRTMKKNKRPGSEPKFPRFPWENYNLPALAKVFKTNAELAEYLGLPTRVVTKKLKKRKIRRPGQ
jgi:hypothetical protein